tara:strand:- start:1197 stop:1901 length:705 start_codon:yes stop_codon:yes gene_type:complete
MPEFKFKLKISKYIIYVSGFYLINYSKKKAEYIEVEKVSIKLSKHRCIMEYFSNDWFTDLYILRNILEQIEFQTSSTRNKLHYCSKKQGGSMLYGSTFRQHPKHYKVQREKDPNNPKLNLTKAKSDHPQLEYIFKEFGKLYFPEFKYNSIQMNKNYIMPPHLDSKNVGQSVLISIGDYIGGDTCLFNEKSRIIEKHDARQQPLKFDGSKILHWVDTIKSKDEDRYSLVFFNSNN